MATTTAWTWEDDENELCNDDGFVFKRRKRLRLQVAEEEQVSTPSQSAAVVDLEADLKQRKRTTLAKLKDRYQKEILQWELLSNTLREVEQRAQQRQQTQLSSGALPHEPNFQPQLDNLLCQVEAQEAIFQDISMLCDAAEALCEAEEERLKQPFLDLPIWVSPQSIFTCLCEEDNCNNNADDT